MGKFVLLFLSVHCENSIEQLKKTVIYTLNSCWSSTTRTSGQQMMVNMIDDDLR